MNLYESMIIINPGLDEQGAKDLVKKFEDLINNLGKVDRIELVGKKKLAYEINKNKEGIFVLFYFYMKPDLVAELERNYRITDNVIKFITIRNDEKK